MSGSPGFAILSDVVNFFGHSVAGLGDMTGDNLADVLVGNPAQHGGAGVTYVVFGQRSGAPVVEQLHGFEIIGENPGDMSGYSVALAGHFNGDVDDFYDIIIGAPHATGNAPNSGASYIIFGKASWTTVDLGNLGANGFKILGEAAYDMCGCSVSGAIDFNGDSIDDVLIGAYNASDGAGRAYVIYGSNNTETINLKDLNPRYGFVMYGANPGDHAGVSVAGGGDVDNDGDIDIIVGADGATGDAAQSGAAYVIWGGEDLPAVQLGNLNGLGFAIFGASSGDLAGASVNAAGNVNNDTFDDVIVGAPKGFGSAAESGVAYVVFGKNDNHPVNLGQRNGSLAIFGVAYQDRAGASVASAGDANNDGYCDVAIGAPQAFGNATLSGAAYVVFGRSGTSTVMLADLPSTGDGYQIFGANSGDAVGFSLAMANDVNDDGKTDIIIGAAPNAPASPGGWGTGSYVVFGKATKDAVHLDTFLLPSTMLDTSCALLMEPRDGQCVPSATLYGVAIGVPFAVVIIAVAVFFVCRRRRNKPSNHPELDGLHSEPQLPQRENSPLLTFQQPAINEVVRIDLIPGLPTVRTTSTLVAEGECRRLFDELEASARVCVDMVPQVRANKQRCQTLAQRLTLVAQGLWGIRVETLTVRNATTLRDLVVPIHDTFESARDVIASWLDFGDDKSEIPRRFLGRVIAALAPKQFAAEFEGVSVELTRQLKRIANAKILPRPIPALDTSAWPSVDSSDIKEDKLALPAILERMFPANTHLQTALIANHTTMWDFQAAMLRNGIKTHQLQKQLQREDHAHLNTIDFSTIAIEEMIGEGSFGTVYRGKWGSQEVAVKCFRCAVLSGKDLRNFEEEAAVATVTRHPNIITTYGACFPPDPPCIVMIYAPRTLYDAIGDGIPWPERLRIVDGLASALAFVHGRDPPLLHRDVKSRNVLLAADGTPLLCDFGLAKHKDMMTSTGSTLPPSQASTAGTRAWQAPEVLDVQPHFGPESDVYSLGMVMYELASGRAPFTEQVDGDIMRDAILRGNRPHIPLDCWGAPPGYVDLMRRCWAQRADERPSAAEVAAEVRVMAAPLAE